METAWASKTPDGQAEWLELTYDAEVDVAGILIHETYNPGAVTRIDAVGGQKGVVVLWSAEPKPVSVDAPRLLFCKPKSIVKAKTLRLTIASDAVAGWNEIDAVGILDVAGKVHWATAATASSSFSPDGSTPFELEIRPTFSPSLAALESSGKNAPPLAAPRDSTPLMLGDALLLVDSAKERLTTSPTADSSTKSDTAADKLKRIEAELELLQKQLDALRASVKARS